MDSFWAMSWWPGSASGLGMALVIGAYFLAVRRWGRKAVDTAMVFIVGGLVGICLLLSGPSPPLPPRPLSRSAEEIRRALAAGPPATTTTMPPWPARPSSSAFKDATGKHPLDLEGDDPWPATTTTSR